MGGEGHGGLQVHEALTDRGTGPSHIYYALAPTEYFSIRPNGRFPVSQTGLSGLLFEIASDERLGILRAVARSPLRHTEIARRLSLTGSETTRHLNRLTGAGLIARDLEGRYGGTPLAEALQLGLPFWEFLAMHRRYLATHRVTLVPTPFVERLGELRSGSFIEGTYPVVAAQEQALRRVERQIWVVTEQRFEQAIPILRDKASRGMDVRVVRSQPRLEQEQREGRDIRRNFLLRTLPEVNVFLAVLDDQAGLCLPTRDGTVDMSTMLLVTDPEGYGWSRDLFLNLWDRAKAPPMARPPAPRSGRGTTRDGGSGTFGTGA
jgi:predicted transcriptional regulator